MYTKILVLRNLKLRIVIIIIGHAKAHLQFARMIWQLFKKIQKIMFSLNFENGKKYGLKAC